MNPDNAPWYSWYDSVSLMLDLNEHRGSVADDPRFRSIVRRSQERFDEKRARIAGELSPRRE